MNNDQKALNIINDWELGTYGCETQKKACLQAAIIEELEAKDKELMILSKGLKAVRELVDESIGVVGLHLNGDLAHWHELMEGGFFEDWLIDFSKAEDLLKDKE